MMRPAELGTASPSDLLRAYAEAAVRHGAASEQGDYRGANKAHDEIAQVYHELRARGQSAVRSLSALLVHRDAAVRQWAAAHMLPEDPSVAEPVLTALSALPGAVGLGASTVLSEWKKGSLRFP